MHTFLKEAKRKQKWTTFARIHRLACQQNTLLCAPSILKHRFSRSLLVGTPVDFKRSEKRSVQTIDAKGKDLLDTDYPRNEGRIANRFSPRNVLWTFLFMGPYRETSLSKINCKNRYFLRIKETSQNKTQNVYRTFLGRKIDLSGVFPK